MPVLTEPEDELTAMLHTARECSMTDPDVMKF
jgi:hypothetical protein